MFVFVKCTEDQSVWSVFWSYTQLSAAAAWRWRSAHKCKWVSQVSEGKGSRGYVQRSDINKVTSELKLGIEGRDGLREE